LGFVGIGSLAELVWGLGGETEDEDTEEETVGGLDVDVGFDQVLPFTDVVALLVAGHVHTVENCVAVATLDILDFELEFSPSDWFILLGEIREGGIADATLEDIGGDLLSLRSVDASLADESLVEWGWGNKLVPFLLQEGVMKSFLGTLSSLGELFVLSDRHFLSGLDQ